MNEKPFNLNQEEGLDDLFRKAADAEQPAAPAHAWLKMNQLLDQEEQKRRYRFAWWWLPLLLFMAGHRHFVPQPGAMKDIQIQSAVSQKQINGAQKESAGSSELLLQQTSPTESPTTESKIVPASVDGVDKKPRGPLKPVSGISRDILTAQKATSPKRKLQVISTIPVRENQSTKKKEDSLPEVTLKNEGAMPIVNTFSSDEKLLSASLPRTERIIIPVSIEMVYPAEPRQSIPSTIKQEKKSYRMYVYGGGGADKGYVNANHSADFKPAYGGGIGLELNKRWAIQAGLIQTRKLYEAPGNAYTPKKGSYYDNPNFVIREVYADCAILEIPLSVRYSFLQQGNHQLFGMLSVQNAVMQRESYDYYYERFGQPATGYYTYRTKALELFSGIGFSLGYEFRLSNRLHIQAAPYLNLPTKGIGEGSVKLRSAGLFAGLRYSFWKKN